MIGIGGQPFVGKEKISAGIMPWIESAKCTKAEFQILPGQGELKLITASDQFSLTRLANPHRSLLLMRII